MPAGGAKLLADVLAKRRIDVSMRRAEETLLGPECLPSTGSYGRFSIVRPEIGVPIGWDRIQRNSETRATR